MTTDTDMLARHLLDVWGYSVKVDDMPDELVIPFALQTLQKAAAELESLRAECDELKQAAVLAMRAVEEVAFGTLKPNMQKLDSYLANGLSDKLWDEINAAALARVGGEK